MRITIVMGFFLPMPPAAGGATEKSWHGLAREFVAAGHDVIVISRTWKHWPRREIIDGVWHLRLPGYDHTPRLFQNLWRDLKWSYRVWRNLPEADVTILNCVTLPVWLGRSTRRAGRLVLMPGRVPKGQFRWYGPVDRILAVSSPVRTALLAENAALGPLIKITGYPIDQSAFKKPRELHPAGPVVIGYVGRIHREKGLDLLVAALRLLATRRDLPAWTVLFCGPSDIPRGGSGAEYAASLESSLARVLPHDRVFVAPPIFEPAALAATYRQIDIFCYPSLAAQGETFGVAVAEAMASGAVPVVSALPCFTDFVRDGENGRVFDHTAADATTALAEVLGKLVRDGALRDKLSRVARHDVARYDFAPFAKRLLDDFSSLK